MSIGVRREQRHEETLGPGHYEPEVSVIKPRTKQATIPSESKSKLEGYDPNLGPGTYQDKPSFGHDGKMFTMKGRPFDNSEVKLGPGEYRPEEAD